MGIEIPVSIIKKLPNESKETQSGVLRVLMVRCNSKKEDVAEAIRDYFIKIFTREEARDDAEVMDALESKVTPEMNKALTKPFTAEEVVLAIKHMHPAKAPGPDGMTPLFYQKFWSLCKADVLHDILNILNREMDPTYLNHTNIVLIPKVKKPKNPKELRPISLSNIVARIISKTIANRLKPFLPDIISDSQSAFVPGRLITDNAMSAFEIFHTMKHRKKGRRGLMAMKLDMSKAYDRVEWDFLERAMEKIGFCRKFTKLVMGTVRTVSYAVLVNGAPTNVFIPERGLRQGDPLSPFLFLFCAEAFSALLKKAEAQGRIHGTKVSKEAPEISHLFFADDSILFTRATLEEAEAVKDVIHKYEQASGQRINLEKTEITCSSNVTVEKKKELADCLGVKSVEKHTKYLGLPTLIGRSKKQVFAGIVDRVVQKMKDWKEKSLSQAGKEVLTKAVIQAIPSYSMNCFLLPITTCQEIERATARFFWGSSLEERKYHWTGWDILTKKKVNGGIGFKELHLFNLAMLAKQVWILLQHPESLAYRLLKAKYFPRRELLEAEVGYQPSYLWRSLLAAKELVKEGEAWRVGDGQSIGITDRWIGVEKQKYPDDIRHLDIANEKVEALIDRQTGRWKRDIIEESFTRTDADRIMAIPLSLNNMLDRRIWRHTPHGFFTVRTAYHVAVAKFSRIHEQRPEPSVMSDVWKKMWKLKVQPRVKMFLWRACHNALATKENLLRRGCSIDPICSLCGEEIESVDHLFLRCNPVCRIWYGSVLRIDAKNEAAKSFRDLIWNRMEKCPPEIAEMMACIAWTVWKKRCEVYLEDGIFDVHALIRRAQVQWQDMAEEQARDTTTEVVTRMVERWRKPDHATCKANCDVAVMSEGLIGLGFVVRDDRGNIVLAGKKEQRAEGSITLLEGYAMRYALQMIKQYGLRIESMSDSKNLIDAINGKQKPTCYGDIIIADIRALARLVGCGRFDYIPRASNQVAHNAARGADFLSIRYNPKHLIPYVDNDIRGADTM